MKAQEQGLALRATDPAPTFLGLTVNLGHVTTTLHSDSDVHPGKSLLAQKQNRFQ